MIPWIYIPGPRTKKIFECGALLTPFTPKEWGYDDLTGSYLIKFYCGNQYMLVVHDFYSNNVLVEPLKNR